MGALIVCAHQCSVVLATCAVVSAGMTLPDLRINCRKFGLNPGGGRETLVQRLTEAAAMGRMRLKSMPKRPPPPEVYQSQSSVPPPYAVLKSEEEKSLPSTARSTTNNYARSEGQNVGNFITDRPSSRVLSVPGGVSQIRLG